MTLASDILQKVTLGAKELGSSLVSGVGTASEFVRKNPVTSAVSVAGGVLAGITAVQIVRKTKSKSAKAKSKAKKISKSKGRDRKFISKQKHEISRRRKKPAKIYGKKGKYYSRKPLRKAGSKSKSRKGIHYTKNGQPYKILSNGRARFIKRRKK